MCEWHTHCLVYPPSGVSYSNTMAATSNLTNVISQQAIIFFIVKELDKSGKLSVLTIFCGYNICQTRVIFQCGVDMSCIWFG